MIDESPAKVKRDQWSGLYKHRWSKSDLSEASWVHPAKVTKGLAFRIVEHAFECGWLRVGSTVLDPFGGIAGFALPLIVKGVNFVGIELEPAHQKTGAANITLWKQRYAGMPNLGDAVLLQGDSRTLLTWGRLEPGRGLEMCCGSPPYVEPPGHDTGHPRLDAIEDERRRQEGCARRTGYGTVPGQLARMPEGNLDAAIGSPNYPMDQPCASQSRQKKDYHAFTRGDGTKRDHSMADPANLATLPEGDVESVISSPPYEASVDSGGEGPGVGALDKHGPRSPNQHSAYSARIGYSTNPTNLGNQSGDTFWSAARTIVANCHALLKPGGVAIWVVGPHVKKGKLVDFPDQWRRLCEAVGFRTLHVHRCPKVETYGTQRNTDGEDETDTVERVSFFRRLANQKGGARVDYEDVLCMERR